MYPQDGGGEDRASSAEAGGLQAEAGGLRRGLFPATGPRAEQPGANRVNITVAPFTGGPFQVNVSRLDTIEELKKVIARRLKVSKERIYLLYRERYV